MGLKTGPYPFPPNYEQLMPVLVQFFQTEAARMTVQEFVAAQVTSYFYLNPVEDDVTQSVADYFATNPPQAGPAPTPQQIQEAVDAYIAQYGTVDDSALAAAVAAFLRANPPQQGAQGPAGQNATPEQVAAAVQSYFNANPLAPLVATQVATYFQANPQPVPATVAPLADNATAVLGTSIKYAREDHRHPLPPGRLELIGTRTVSESMLISVGLGVRRVTTALTGVTTADRLVGVVTGAPSAGSGFLDCFPTSAGNIGVDAIVPALGIGATWSIPLAIYRIV